MFMHSVYKLSLMIYHYLANPDLPNILEFCFEICTKYPYHATKLVRLLKSILGCVSLKSVREVVFSAQPSYTGAEDIKQSFKS